MLVFPNSQGSLNHQSVVVSPPSLTVTHSGSGGPVRRAPLAAAEASRRRGRMECKAHMGIARRTLSVLSLSSLSNGALCSLSQSCQSVTVWPKQGSLLEQELRGVDFGAFVGEPRGN